MCDFLDLHPSTARRAKLLHWRPQSTRQENRAKQLWNSDTIDSKFLLTTQLNELRAHSFNF